MSNMSNIIYIRKGFMRLQTRENSLTQHACVGSIGYVFAIHRTALRNTQPYNSSRGSLTKPTDVRFFIVIPFLSGTKLSIFCLTMCKKVQYFILFLFIHQYLSMAIQSYYKTNYIISNNKDLTTKSHPKICRLRFLPTHPYRKFTTGYTQNFHIHNALRLSGHSLHSTTRQLQ